MSKYGNVKTVVNGIKFDSKREAARYGELMLLWRAGEITELRLQPRFTLQEASMTPNGDKIPTITYVADFSYIDHGELVVEDAKGVRTAVYKLKAKMMIDKFGIMIREV